MHIRKQEIDWILIRMLYSYICARMQGTWSSRLGLDTKVKNMLFKKISIVKCKEVKTGCSLAESSKEGYGSKRVVLPMMMVVLYMTQKWAFKVTVT